MRLSVFALVLGLIPWSAALAEDKNPAYGVWMTDGGKSKVHVTECDGGLYSKIIWLKNSIDTDGLPQLDEHNPDAEMRKRQVVGINILDGLTQTARYEWEGEVYNPEDGKKYKAYLALIKPDVLRLKGCMSMGWPCRSKFWKKLDEEPPSESEPITASPEQGLENSAGQQIADNGANLPDGEPQVMTQSLNGQEQIGRDASAGQIAAPPAPRAAPPQALNPPQSLTPPRQISPPQQAIREPIRAPQQIARAPKIPASPPLPKIAKPKPAAPNPPVAAAPPVVVAPPIPPPPPAAEVIERRAPPRPPVQPRSQAAIAPPPPMADPQPRLSQEGRRFAALPDEASRPQSDDGNRYLVQVAARQNRQEALDVFNKLRRRYPQLLGPTQPIIVKKDLGDLGIWYRVRVGPITGKSAALAFCNRLKFAGSDCFIRRQ